MGSYNKIMFNFTQNHITMKRLFLVLAVSTFFISCKEDATKKIKSENVEMATQRDAKSNKLPVMTFDKIEHDFGNIISGTEVETTFTFTNTGDAPLIITNAESTCGCTVPDYPKNKPIAPGEKGELVVKFNGAGQNQVTKAVTISTNTAKGKDQIRIKAFVEPKDKVGSPMAQ